MKHRNTIAVLAAAALASSATAALGAESRTLSASFEVAAPCVELTLDDLPDNSAAALSTSARAAQFSSASQTTRRLFGAQDANGKSTQGFDIVNCGTGTQELGVHVSDVTVGNATWSAVSPAGNPLVCDLGLNQVYFDLFRQSGDLYDWTRLSTQVSAMGWTADAGAAYGDSFRVELAMPCEGSDGAGQTANFDVTFTALYPQS